MPNTLTRRGFLQKLGLAALTAPVVAVAASMSPEATGVAAQGFEAPVAPLTASQATSDLNMAKLQQLANLHKQGLISKADFQKEFGLTDEKQLTKSKYLGDNSYGQRDSYYVEVPRPRLTIVPANQPTKDDPLGQYGFVSYKFSYKAKMYGDYMKLIDPVQIPMTEEAIHIAARQHLARLNPQAVFI